MPQTGFYLLTSTYLPPTGQQFSRRTSLHTRKSYSLQPLLGVHVWTDDDDDDDDNTPIIILRLLPTTHLITALKSPHFFLVHFEEEKKNAPGLPPPFLPSLPPYLQNPLPRK